MRGDHASQPPSTPSSAPTNLDERGLPVGYPYKPEFEVTPREVKAWLDRGAGERSGGERDVGGGSGGVLLDCRRPEEWLTARIEGARLIPMQDVGARIEELEDENGGRESSVVVYCHHGVRSLRVALMLRAAGFTDVRSMAGGIDLWSVDVDPSVPRY